jgi:hypothetical protein
VELYFWYNVKSTALTRWIAPAFSGALTTGPVFRKAATSKSFVLLFTSAEMDLASQTGVLLILSVELGSMLAAIFGNARSFGSDVARSDGECLQDQVRDGIGM